MTCDELRVGPVIPVSDLSKALEFYEGALGLVGEPVAGGYQLRCGAGTSILLLIGTDHAGQATWPLASFGTDDLERTIDRLRRRGVSVETIAEGPERTDERGVSRVGGSSVVWIRDPDRQLISIVQPA